MVEIFHTLRKAIQSAGEKDEKRDSFGKKILNKFFEIYWFKLFRPVCIKIPQDPQNRNT